MGKHHGSEERKSVKIATKNSLISKLRNGASATLKQQGPEGRKSIKISIEKDDFSYFFLLLLLLLLLLRLLFKRQEK